MTDSAFIQRRTWAEPSTWPKKQPVLSRLDLELTERCNNNCLHCFINRTGGDVDAKNRELTTAQWQRILHEAAELGALTVRLTGGEPLLREDFAELYLTTRHLGIEVELFTNARLLTPELADLFHRVPPRNVIEVTVYGMRAESYESVSRVPGSFAEFKRGLGLLEHRQVPFIMKSAWLPPNADEIEEFEAWAKTIPWMRKRPSYATCFDLRGRRDSEEKNQTIRALRVSPQQCLSLWTRDKTRFIEETAAFCEKFGGPPGEMLFCCGAGQNVCVDAYGQLQMCLLLRCPSLNYDLKNGTLREAMTQVLPQYQTLKAANPEYLKRCARCFLKSLCEQCPAKSWAEHGNLDTPVEYLCEVAHAQARFLGLLSATEKAWEIPDWKARIAGLQVS